MNQDWQQIKSLYHDASLLPEPARASFLQEKCASNRALQDQVIGLLKSAKTSPPFWDYPSLTGETLGHYEILDRLGAGANALVYEARDIRLDRKVVIKLLPPFLAEDTLAVERFKNEAKYLAALHHPNIVTVYGEEQTPEFVFIVLEFVEGETLGSRLRTGGLSFSNALRYMRQLAEAIAASHDRGIVHRDLKPSNVLIDANDDVKLVDFGLAKGHHESTELSRSEITPPGLILGTTGYMSPEQARGGPVDERSDIFSLGVLFYEMLAGHKAFSDKSDAETMASVFRDTPPRLTGLVPEWIATMVARCLQKEPSQRFSSVREMLDLFDREDDGTSAHPAVKLGRRGNLVKLGWLWGGVGVFVAMSVSIAFRNSLVLLPAAWREPTTTQTPDALFNRGLNTQAKAEEASCRSNVQGCFIPTLRRASADLSSVLEVRPGHHGSLWNRGLVYAELCDGELRSRHYQSAVSFCNQAVADFNQALLPGVVYPDLSSQRANEADLLLNRGYVRRQMALAPFLNQASKRALLDQAIYDYDAILSHPGRYAPFLLTRRVEVVSARKEASEARKSLDE